MTNTITHNLTGFVRNQGLAVAGVSVVLYDSGAPKGAFARFAPDFIMKQVRTNNRGEFQFDLRPGRYRIDVEPDRSTRFLHHTSMVSVEPGGTVYNINLSAGMILSGTVRTGDGAVISNGEIAVLGIEPTAYREIAELDEQGRYNVTLPRGRYHVAFHCHQKQPTEVEPSRLASSAFVSNEIIVLDVQSDDTFDFVLPEFAKFTAEIVDPSGKPVANARIDVHPSQPKDRMLALELGLSANCYSSSSGRFAVLAQPGLYDVRIEPSPSDMLFGLQEPAMNLSQDLNRRFQLADGFRLRGQVHYVDESLSNCLVRVQGLDMDLEVLAKTDDKGQFSVSVPSGNYKLIVSAHPKDAPTVTIDGEEFSGLAPWTRVVVVGRDTHVAVRLQQGTALYGKILDEQGQPRPGVRISAFADGGKSIADERLEHALATGSTDGEGKYCLFVSPGTYWLAVHTDLANASRIEVGAEPTHMDITWRGWCRAQVEVLGEDGHKIPRCRVAFAPYPAKESDLAEITDEAGIGSLRGCSLTDDDGIAILTIPANVYTLRLGPPPDSSYESKWVKQVSISSDWQKSFRVPVKQPQ